MQETDDNQKASFLTLCSYSKLHLRIFFKKKTESWVCVVADTQTHTHNKNYIDSNTDQYGKKLRNPWKVRRSYQPSYLITIACCGYAMCYNGELVSYFGELSDAFQTWCPDFALQKPWWKERTSSQKSSIDFHIQTTAHVCPHSHTHIYTL